MLCLWKRVRFHFQIYFFGFWVQWNFWCFFFILLLFFCFGWWLLHSFDWKWNRFIIRSVGLWFSSHIVVVKRYWTSFVTVRWQATPITTQKTQVRNFGMWNWLWQLDWRVSGMGFVIKCRVLWIYALELKFVDDSRLQQTTQVRNLVICVCLECLRLVVFGINVR